MTSLCRLALLFLLATPAWPSAAAAHTFWIEPESYSLPVGDTVYAVLKVGEEFVGEQLPYVSDYVTSLTATGRDRRRDIVGVDGDDPAIRMAADSEGLLAISYYSTADIVEFDDAWEPFKRYLAHEGLHWVSAAHMARGLSTKTFSEIYYRCAKALVQVGRANAEDIDRYTGMPFELVVDGNPYMKTAGDRLGVRALWQGEPYAAAQVTVIRHDSDLHKLTLTTDADGHVEVPVGDGGRFLLSSVHMQAAPDDIEPVWQSHWASLTFEIAGGEEAR